MTGLEPGWWCEGLGETAIAIDALAEITFRGRPLINLAKLALL